VIGQRAVLARRSGDTWFLVGINGTTSPLALNNIDLSFLGAGNYEAILLTDDTQFSINSQLLPQVNASFDLDVSMISGGGFVAMFATAFDIDVFGDLNGDHLVDAADWTLFKAGQGTNFTGLSAAEAYLQGDLNGDFQHDLEDFVLFRTAYEAQHGAGSFTSLATVPEPAAVALLAIGGILGATGLRRHRIAQ
jgi:hypothetical protein